MRRIAATATEIATARVFGFRCRCLGIVQQSILSPAHRHDGDMNGTIIDM